MVVTTFATFEPTATVGGSTQFISATDTLTVVPVDFTSVTTTETLLPTVTVTPTSVEFLTATSDATITLTETYVRMAPPIG